MSFFKQTRPFQPPNGHSPASPRLRNIAYVYQLTTFVSLGTLLFGYDQGIMGVIVADDRWVSLTQPANSWVTGAVISLYDIGCFVGAMSVGILADSCGRERTVSCQRCIHHRRHPSVCQLQHHADHSRPCRSWIWRRCLCRWSPALCDRNRTCDHPRPHHRHNADDPVHRRAVRLLAELRIRLLGHE
jgi:hypothetical protein